MECWPVPQPAIRISEGLEREEKRVRQSSRVATSYGPARKRVFLVLLFDLDRNAVLDRRYRRNCVAKFAFLEGLEQLLPQQALQHVRPVAIAQQRRRG